MANDVQQIVTNEITVQKIWADGARSGNETFPEIFLSGSSAGSTIWLGRRSSTAGNNTTLKLTNRTNDAGFIFNTPTTQMQIIDNAAPSSSISTGVLLDLQSTTKGFRPTRLTTAEANTLSGNLVSSLSGLLLYDTGLNKLKVWTGKSWETITSTIGL